VDKHHIDTERFEVIDAMVTYDAKQCVALCKNPEPDDNGKDEYKITGYSLKSFSKKWSNRIPGTFLRMAEIQ